MPAQGSAGQGKYYSRRLGWIERVGVVGGFLIALLLIPIIDLAFRPAAGLIYGGGQDFY
jgi:hypothetical protein